MNICINRGLIHFSFYFCSPIIGHFPVMLVHCCGRSHSVEYLVLLPTPLDYFSSRLIMASKHPSYHYEISAGTEGLCDITSASTATILMFREHKHKGNYLNGAYSMETKMVEPYHF